jgi:hypothetical protein
VPAVSDSLLEPQVLFLLLLEETNQFNEMQEDVGVDQDIACSHYQINNKE